MRILLTNDDGIDSESLIKFAEKLCKICDLTVYAPSGECSGFSHSLSLHKTIKVEEEKREYKAFRVFGTPVDCVKVGVTQSPYKYDLVISGVNKGTNLATDVWYSGTVQAAYEGAIAEIPAIALSTKKKAVAGLDTAIDFFLNNFQKLYELAQKTAVLSINVPDLTLNEMKGVVFAPLGRTLYNDSYGRKEENMYEHISTLTPYAANREECDIYAFKTGNIVLTPLSLDCTDYNFLTKNGDLTI